MLSEFLRAIRSMLFRDLVRSSCLVKHEGCLFNLNTKTFGERKLATTSEYEPWITMLLHHMISEGDIVIDVGANVGFHTLPCSNLVGASGVVYAFEPNIQNINRLQLNIKLNGRKNIVVCDKALSNKQGLIEFHEFGDESFYSGNHSCVKHESMRQLETQEPIVTRMVESVRLDDFCTVNAIQPDFIKLDVEGYEYSVLLGAKETLKKGPSLIFEYNSQRNHSVGIEPLQFKKLLQGYRCYEILRSTRRKPYVSLVPFCFDRDSSCDILAVPDFK